VASFQTTYELLKGQTATGWLSKRIMGQDDQCGDETLQMIVVEHNEGQCILIQRHLLKPAHQSSWLNLSNQPVIYTSDIFYMVVGNQQSQHMLSRWSPNPFPIAQYAIAMY
jgi:hypothetical protein